MHYPTLSNRTQCLKKYRLHFSVFSIVRFSHVFLLNLECLWFSFIAFLYLSVYISLFLSSIFVKWKKSFSKGSVNLNVCKIAWAEIALTIQKEEVSVFFDNPNPKKTFWFFSKVVQLWNRKSWNIFCYNSFSCSDVFFLGEMSFHKNETKWWKMMKLMIVVC